MEDELERNSTTLFTINEKNISESRLLYVYMPSNKGLESCIITPDINVINNLKKENKNCKIEVFKQDKYGLYKCLNS